jgi:phosphoglycolate phosphatase-like HAD superfamily hydrolase
MIRAVLYDHDGTLVDSLALVVAATNLVLERRGLPTRPGAEIIAGMVHPTAPRMGLHAGVADPDLQRALAAEFYAAGNELADRDHATAYSGVSAMLAGFAEAGLRQAVISNNQGRLIRRLLANLGLVRHFGAVLGEEDMPAPKPDPGGLRIAALRLGVPLAACVYVGDTPGDLHTAQAAAIRCIGVTWGITARAELARHPFAALVDRPESLPAIVRSLG